MTVDQIMEELEALGSPSTKKVLINHGAVEPFFGVKIQDMKTILKRTKYNQTLAESLFETGNGDAMYLAGLMAEPHKMNKESLQNWVKKAPWSMVSEYTVPWVASMNAHGWELGLEWIDSEEEKIATSGWATLSYCTLVLPDDSLDIEALKQLLSRVEKNIHASTNRVSYTMNGFVIAVGSSVSVLTDHCIAMGEKIGKVSVYMGKTSCKVPLIAEYIAKVQKAGKIGTKRKDPRC